MMHLKLILFFIDLDFIIEQKATPEWCGLLSSIQNMCCFDMYCFAHGYLYGGA